MSSGLDEMRKIIREQEPLRPSSRLTKELETAKSNDGQSCRTPEYRRSCRTPPSIATWTGS